MSALSVTPGTPSGLSWEGEPLDVWGLRVPSGAVTEEWTAALTGQFDTYLRYGVNAVTVFYQGSSGGWVTAFSPDGRNVDEGIQARMERIAEEAAARRMVVVAGIFYQRSEWLESSDAYERAAELVSRRLARFPNVVVNVVNEHNGGRWRECPFPATTPDGIARLCEAARQGAQGQLLVGGGGIHPGVNAEIALRPEVDLLLFDWHGTSKEAVDSYRAAGSQKPLWNVEIFGGWGQGHSEEDDVPETGRNHTFPGWHEGPPPAGRRRIQGVFPAGGVEGTDPKSKHRGKADYLAEIEYAASTADYALFGHFPAWFQGPSRDPSFDCRYDLGGDGTREDPGIRWYFEAVARARGVASRQ